MLHLEVITPQGSVLSAPVDEVTAPGIEGEFHADRTEARGVGDRGKTVGAMVSGIMAICARC